jgi:hypothetical protein
MCFSIYVRVWVSQICEASRMNSVPRPCRISTNKNFCVPQLLLIRAWVAHLCLQWIWMSKPIQLTKRAQRKLSKGGVASQPNLWLQYPPIDDGNWQCILPYLPLWFLRPLPRNISTQVFFHSSLIPLKSNSTQVSFHSRLIPLKSNFTQVHFHSSLIPLKSNICIINSPSLSRLQCITCKYV